MLKYIAIKVEVQYITATYVIVEKVLCFSFVVGEEVRQVVTRYPKIALWNKAGIMVLFLYLFSNAFQ